MTPCNVYLTLVYGRVSVLSEHGLLLLITLIYSFAASSSFSSGDLAQSLNMPHKLLTSELYQPFVLFFL